MEYQHPSYTDITLVLLHYLLLYTIHPMNNTSFKYKPQQTKPERLSLLYKKSELLSTIYLFLFCKIEEIS